MRTEFNANDGLLVIFGAKYTIIVSFRRESNLQAISIRITD